jgi:hypothetical protein
VVNKNEKAMRGKSHGPASLPSAALPASGSKGSIDVRADHLSQAAPPHSLFSVRIRLSQAKSMNWIEQSLARF